MRQPRCGGVAEHSSSSDAMLKYVGVAADYVTTNPQINQAEKFVEDDTLLNMSESLKGFSVLFL